VHVHTEMYESVQGVEKVEGGGSGRQEQRRGSADSSMYVGSEQTELGGFRERRERLERAARLLEGSARGQK